MRGVLVSWNTTSLCNLRCPHCYREAGERDPQELSYQEGLQLIEEVKKAGFKIMVFSGGEPLMRSDIFDLIGYARKAGLRPVLGTNGTLLSPENVRRLKEAGVAAAGISLDSCHPDRHDRFRGVSGAWQAAREGMENCRQGGLPFQVHTTVFPWNYQEIEDLTRLAAEAGARGHHVFFFVPTGRGRQYQEVITAEQSEDLLLRLLRNQAACNLEIKPTCAPQFMRVARQHRLSTRYTRGCLAGISYCIIGPRGEVYPCPYLDLEVDNVRKKPFDEIWAGNEVFLQLRSQKYDGFCGVCKYRTICGGCRARAFEKSGQLTGEDPQCLYKLQQEEQLAPLAEKLVFKLQGGIPLVERPFHALACELGVREGEVLRALRWLKTKGVIRRLGATFNPGSLGYETTLCAARVPSERMEEVAGIINSYECVTHNYVREHEYNLWFTLTAESQRRLEELINEMAGRTGLEILSMPAREIFKIAVNFPEEELQGVFRDREEAD